MEPIVEVTWAANQAESTEFLARGTEAGATLELGGEELTIHGAGRQGTDHLVDATVSEGVAVDDERRDDAA